jgi:glycosyltransferase involved in cell wall biosynthesis
VRILHVVARSQRRGAETAALELAEELDALGHDDRIVALNRAFDGGSDPAFPELAPGSRAGPAALLTSVRRLRRLLDEEPVDVVLAHGGRAVQVAAMARRRGGPPVVWQRILGFPDGVWRPGRRHAWRLVVERVDAAVALTPDLGDELRRLGFTRPIWVIANTRRPQRFLGVDRAEAAARMRAELGLAADVPLVGFVGHLIEQKRPERALDVLVRVRGSGVPAHLVVAGDGPLREHFERELVERGLSAEVHLLGHRADIEVVLGALDLLVLTSDSEGMPGVAIEASMAGCPVLTFPLGGVRDVVDDGVTGVVTERADTAIMAEHAVRLLGSPDERRRLGDEARRRADRFSTARAAREYAERFEELLAVRAPA